MESAAILDHASNDSCFGAGFGWAFHRYLTFELDVNLSTTSYRMPGSATETWRDLERYALSLSTSGILGNLKLGRRLGRFTPHVGVGFGLGLVDVSVTDEFYWGHASEPLSSGFSVLTQLLAGLDVRVGRWSTLGIEYRELSAHRTIEFAGEEIDGGGESLLFAYRHRF